MRPASSLAPKDWAPALLTLIGAAAALALRPAIPLDETRYMEILRESLGGSYWLLQWNGEAYADKPPLLFWLARALHGAGVLLEVSLRSLPPLAAAGTVLVTALMGRRLGLRWAAWIQAVLLLPAAYASPVLVDPLMVLAIWGTLAAWSTDRDVLTTPLAALAFLAKGPVALVILLPLGYTLAPLRTRRISIGRTIGQIALAFVPLAAWALLALRAAGGGGFAAEILWERWGARIYSPVSHAESALFFVPVLVLGLLPFTPLLLLREPALRTPVLRRLPWALLAVVVCFSLFPGKQVHYLLPTMPGFALLLGARLEASERARLWLHRAVLGWLAVMLVAVLVPIAWPAPLLEHFGTYGRQLTVSGTWTALVVLALGVISIAGLTAFRGGPTRALVATVCAFWATLAPLQYAAGQLVLPRGVAALLAYRTDADLVLFRNRESGLYNWLGRRDRIEELHEVDELAAWFDRHPNGLVILRDVNLADLEPLGLEPVLHDRTRGKPVTVLTSGGERVVHAHSPWTNQRLLPSR